MKRPGLVERACFAVAAGVLGVSASIGFDDPIGLFVAYFAILLGGWGLAMAARHWLADERQRKMQKASLDSLAKSLVSIVSPDEGRT